MAEEGYSWGTDASPAPILEYGWDGSDQGAGGSMDPWKIWEDPGIGENASYTSALGQLRMVVTDDFVSDVIDRGAGATTGKWFSVSYNGTIHELIGIWWRGHADTSFNPEDAAPAWEQYPIVADGANKLWRYVQVRVVCYERVVMDADDVTMDGEPVTM